MPSPVSWRYDYTTEPWLRWLVRAGAGAVFGAYTGMLATLAVAAVAVLVGGSPEVRLVVVVLALVGGPFSLLYLLPVLTDPDQRPHLAFSGRERRVPVREWVVSGLVGAVVLGGAVWVDPRLAAALFVGGLLAGVVGVLCSTRGTVDPETATAESGPREWDLSRVSGYTTRRVGPLVVVSFAAAGPGRFGTVPSRIVVPAAVADDVAAALDAIVAEVHEDDGRDANPTVRAVAIALAVLSAGGGLAASTLGGPVGWYVAATGVVFAGIFLLVAVEG